MEDRLVAETQLEEDTRTVHQARQDAVVARGMNHATDIVDESALSPETQALIQRCMEGTEPFDTGYGEERLYWQQQKFNTQHIQVVMTRVAGFKQVEIARMLGLDQARVCVILRHPYAKKIIQAIIPSMGARVIDIRTRLESFSAEMLDHVFKLAIVSTDVKEVREVTFGLLDRAGYNPVNKSAVATGTPKDFAQVASEMVLNRLSGALEESKAVDSHVMPSWKTPVPPDDGAEIDSGGRYSVLDPVPESAWVPQDATPEPEQPGSSAGGSQRTGTHN